MSEYYTKRLVPETWTRSSLSVCKPSTHGDITKIFIGYVENSKAYVGEAGLEMYYILSETANLGPAIDISVCYDGRWVDNGLGLYNFFTVGEAYIAIVDTANRLYVRQGSKGASILLATEVTQCYMVRGWKHISDPDADQGLCVFYIRQGEAYSRAFVQIDATTYLWQAEERHPTLGTGVLDLTVKRSADFRLIIIAKKVTENLLAVTTRVFPGMSVQAETVALAVRSIIQIDAGEIQIQKTTTKETIRVTTAASTSLTQSKDRRATEILGANNVGSKQIWLRLTVNPSTLSAQQDFYNIIVSDSLGMSFPVISAQVVALYVLLTVMDFSNAAGDIQVKYTAGMKAYEDVLLGPFTIVFTPTGLVPVIADPPVITETINVNTEVV